MGVGFYLENERDGDIAYHNGTQWDVLHRGTSGQVLTETAGLRPSWATPTPPPAAATQAEQETATSTTTYVSPGRQQFHPSAAKLWLKATQGSTTIEASYNITSVADTATGLMTVTIATDFSGEDWAGFVSLVEDGQNGTDSATFSLGLAASPAAGTCVMQAANVDGGDADVDLMDPSTAWCLVGFGDQ